MKFSLSWLKTHLQTDATVAEISDTLTRIGLEVEGIEDPGSALRNFVVAQVIKAEQHPNADRLRVCQVDIGGTELVSVVCGAPNARTSMKAVFAPPGSFIPGTGTTLKTGEIRGVQSAGMLLSYREMGRGDDHSGIVELPDDAPVGMPFPTWDGLDDPIIEISVTPNRGDALSVRGVARDLAAAQLGGLKAWHAPSIRGEFPSPVRWQLDWPEACPWVLGRTIRGMTNGPSPAWLADRLTSIGLRPINALVDVTNFFTIDLGRPLHVFDARKITGDRLVIRRGAGEKFGALDGREYTATPEDCAIADAAGVQSLAGIMGGAATGCDLDTSEVFVECALFDPIRIALTGRRLQLTSDARQRFERGVDPALLPAAMEAATRMILDLCGGAASDVVAAGAEPVWQRSATMRFSRLAGLGGSDISPADAISSLERLGFAVVAQDSQKVTVGVPSWRRDVAAPIALDFALSLSSERAAIVAEGCAAIEPEVDLIEEVLRLRGLDAITPVSLPAPAAVPPQTLTPEQNRIALARRTLAAQGLVECVTFSFMASAVAQRFGDAPETLRLTNPIAADLDQLRPTPVATLAQAAQRNAARGAADCALFEIGPAFQGDAQRRVAAGLRTGHTPRSWLAPSRPVDALDAKADAIAVLAALGVPMEAVTATPDAQGFYHPGRSGVLRQGPKTILAQFGELHPSLVAALDLPAPAVAFEIFFDAIPAQKKRRRAAPNLSPFQAVRRDFALLADPGVPADAVMRAARGAERNLIKGVVLFDVFLLPSGQTSLGVEVTFQSAEKTLTDPEIEAASKKVIDAVAKATGARLR
jgi:phenylalanyl-tRNA synthetase beta chain